MSRHRTAANLFPSVIALMCCVLVGCTTRTVLPRRMVGFFAAGETIRTQGNDVSIEDAWLVEALPKDGIELRPVWENPRQTGQAPEVEAPVRIETATASWRFVGANGAFTVPRMHVKAIIVHEYSPGKTAGVVAPVTIGVSTVVGLIVGAAIALRDFRIN